MNIQASPLMPSLSQPQSTPVQATQTSAAQYLESADLKIYISIAGLEHYQDELEDNHYAFEIEVEGKTSVAGLTEIMSQAVNQYAAIQAMGAATQAA